MAKKVLALFLSMVMLVSVLTVPALADEREITVIYNGENLEFDVPPMLINSRTMVPMRAIFEALGGRNGQPFRNALHNTEEDGF